MSEEEQIKEINDSISQGIAAWADIMLEAEADRWAFFLNYTPLDLMNAIFIFQHVLSNIGIKEGKIDDEKAAEFGERLRQLVVDMTGYDPREIAELMKPILTDLINPSTIIEA